MVRKKGRIPNTLRWHRRCHGISQRSVAKLLDMKKSSLISQWESGVTVPNLESLFKLCILYDVGVDELYPELITELRKKSNSMY